MQRAVIGFEPDFGVMEHIIKWGGDAVNYVGTPEWFHALVDTLTGFVLLSVFLPIIFLIAQRIRRRHQRSLIDFYLFQVFHKLLRMFMEMGDVGKIDSSSERRRDGVSLGSSHFFYGNLDDILAMMKTAFKEKERLEKVLASKSIMDLEKYLQICEGCIAEVDRLVAMIGGFPSIQEELFEFRLVPFILRDRILEVFERSKKAEKGTANFAITELVNCAEIFTAHLDKLFQKKRRLIDSMVKHRDLRQKASLIASLPYVLIYRWLGIRVCRLRRVPYNDPWASSMCSGMLKVWREKNHFTIDEAAAVLGIAKRRYRDIEYGYTQPRFGEWEPVKEHLRGEVDYLKFRDEIDKMVKQ